MCRDASPGIEFIGNVNNVSAQELEGDRKVKREAVCQEKRGSLGASLPAGWDGNGGFPSAPAGCWEEKVTGKRHMCLSSGYRTAHLAENTFKSSPAFTDCSKKLLNFLCDLTVFLSG